MNYSVMLNKVSKVYKSESVEVDALIDISFTLKRGEFVAIVGPSGSGKSTLMNVLGTIDKPTQGEIYIDGVATSKMDGDKLAEFRNQKLGFIFQAYNLVNGLTAEMNVQLPLMVNKMPQSERKERSDSLLTQLGLADRIRQKPNQLSGGQQQRVAIARALVNNPALVLADEPTGNLDTKSGEEVVKLFKRISRERKVTIIMVTHNPDITRFCDRVIHLKDGRVNKNEVIR
ncbi:MAG TPA: ABC transporter ATP-binding protein [Candidatus Baltobacteraceae bacterium]|nr:ABC transporter ATP-binding protein [Candidatus Baltobacteraceae bacterium]